MGRAGQASVYRAAAVMRAQSALRCLLTLTMLGVVVGAPDSDDPQDQNRLRRLTSFIQSYTVSQGINMMITDNDIKCIMSLGSALRNDHNALLQPAATLWALLVKTTPLCKVNLLAKSRMFLRPDFAKGTVSVLLNQDMNKETSAASLKKSE